MKVRCLFLTCSPIFMTDHLWIRTWPHVWTPRALLQRGSWRWREPSSSVSSPPPLADLDTLPQGGHVDPISWCSALHPTPRLHLSPGPLCPSAAPFKCLGPPPRRLSLKKWLMPVYFRKAKAFPCLGGGDWRRAEEKPHKGRKWRWPGQTYRCTGLWESAEVSRR